MQRGLSADEIGYEYTYSPLGRVVQSVERPSGDTTAYAYTPAGRLGSEQRTGQVAYSRSYGYNPAGSRAEVSHDDALNGSHWDIYFYEEASGRLTSVLDVWTGEVNQFVWNAEGTLARWVSPVPTSDGEKIIYERQFEYTDVCHFVEKVQHVEAHRFTDAQDIAQNAQSDKLQNIMS